MSERHVIFNAEIVPASPVNFTNLLVNLFSSGMTKLVLAVNSPGGNVVAGVAIYNTLMALPIDIVTHNIGNVDSITNVIFLAGKERFSCSTSTFMFHGIGFPGNANERLEEKNLKEKLDIITSSHKRLAGVISSRTSLSVREVRNLFAQQRTVDSIWAKSKGIISDIRPYALPNPSEVSIFS
jgi:ATP-dependent Clp protease, protease subunit